MQKILLKSRNVFAAKKEHRHDALLVSDFADIIEARVAQVTHFERALFCFPISKIGVLKTHMLALGSYRDPFGKKIALEVSSFFF